MERGECGKERGTAQGGPGAPEGPASASLDPGARKQSLHGCTWSATGRARSAAGPCIGPLDPRARKQSLHGCTWSATGRTRRASAEQSQLFGSRSLKAKPRQSLGCEMFIGINICEGKEGEAGLDRGRSQR